MCLERFPDLFQNAAAPLLKTLHAGRNHRPAADTIGRLLEHTRAHVSFVLRPAGEGRLFMGFSVQERVDLSDHDAVAAAVRSHLPEATVAATAGHDWVGDRFSQGTWLSVPPTWFSDGTFETLAVPEGRLAFAGSDIATEGAGWIEGAVGSGVDAAAHLLGVLAAR